MGTFAKKLSLYDMLSMVIPGGILLRVLSIYCPDLYSIANGIACGHSNLFLFFFFCPLAYIIGICNHVVASKLWHIFRNNPYIIVSCLDDEIGQFNNTQKLQDKRRELHIASHRIDAFNDFVHYSFIMAVALLAIGMVIDGMFSLCLNYCAIITLSVLYIGLYGVSTLCWNTSTDEEKKVTKLYYEAYYYVQQASRNSDISVMEGQVAFLQSMTIPLSLLIVSHFNLCVSSCYPAFRLLLLVVYICIFPVVYNRIKKIHSRVWEDYEFLSQLENPENQKHKTMQKEKFLKVFMVMSILFMLMPVMAMAERIPVAILRTNADGKTKTLTFTYAERPKVFAKRGQNGIHRLNAYKGWNQYSNLDVAPTWIGVHNNPGADTLGVDFYPDKTITTVIFNSSFAQARPKTTSYWFYYLDKLREIKGIEYLNTSNTVNMGDMFAGCSNLISLNCSNFDTSNVKWMSGMFSGCKKMSIIDVSDFNTSNVTDMARMFSECSSLRKLDLSGFNTSNVTNMFRMFCKCSSLSKLDLSGFNTSKVYTMDVMFEGCKSLDSLDLSNFDTRGVERFTGMFEACSNLTYVKINGFNTSKAVFCTSMFSGCTKLTSIDISTFDLSNVLSIEDMFKNCSSLTSIDISNLNIGRIITNRYEQLSTPAEDGWRPDISWINLRTAESVKDIFYGCSGLKRLNIGNNDFSSLKYNREAIGNVFNKVGTFDNPCQLIVGPNFNKSVLGVKHDNGNGGFYRWLGGYFTLEATKSTSSNTSY